MNRLLNLQKDLEIQKERAKTLDYEYMDKLKGEVYHKAKELIIKRMKGIQGKARSLGCNYAIAQIKGKRRRPNRKTPTIFIEESFTIYFAGITEDEVSTLIKLHVPNVVEYTVRYFKSGQILTTRN